MIERTVVISWYGEPYKAEYYDAYGENVATYYCQDHLDGSEHATCRTCPLYRAGVCVGFERAHKYEVGDDLAPND